MSNSRGTQAGRPARFVLLVFGVLLAAAMSVLAWLAFTGALAANQLRTADSSIRTAQSLVASGDVAAVESMAPQIGASTSTARAYLNDPVWRMASHLPLIGATAETISASATSLDVAAQGSIEPLAGVGQAVSGGKLRRPDGAIDLAAIERLRQPTALAAASTSRALSELNAAPIGDAFGPVRELAQRAQGELVKLHSSATAAATGTAVIPPMMGKAGTQRYFVAFTSPAEARGTGGFLGTFGILRAQGGKLTVERIGSNSELTDFRAPVADLGPDYRKLYRDLSRVWSGMNLSPHFPFAAKQWIAGWHKQTGQRLQGALAIDPGALSYLVSATRPVTLPDGRSLTAKEVVPYLANGIYREFDGRNEARKKYQVAIAKQTMASTLAAGAGQQIAAPLARAASERRLLAYSTDPVVQHLLEPWPVSGTVDTLPGPFAMAVVNNAAGNKADYYLQRSLSYRTAGCASGAQDSVITTVLTNSMPPANTVPGYISNRADGFAKHAKPGSTRVLLEILLPMESWPVRLTVAGRQVPIVQVTEAGRPAVITAVELPRQLPITTTLQLREAFSATYPRVPVQPLAEQQTSDVDWSPCSAK